MKGKELTDKQLIFIEEMGIFHEKSGLPRMAGRIYGLLLVSSSPYLTIQNITHALKAAKGSVSTNTRLLTDMGLIERITIPQDRLIYFRIRESGEADLMRNRMSGLPVVVALAKRGIDAATTTHSRKLLNEIVDFYDFMDKHVSELLATWQKNRAKLLKK